MAVRTSLKSPFVMQILTDLLGMPIKVTKSDQTCALGAAMYAAVMVYIYPTIQEAKKYIEQACIRTYYPNGRRREVYNGLYENIRLMLSMHVFVNSPL